MLKEISNRCLNVHTKRTGSPKKTNVTCSRNCRWCFLLSSFSSEQVSGRTVTSMSIHCDCPRSISECHLFTFVSYWGQLPSGCTWPMLPNFLWSRNYSVSLVSISVFFELLQGLYLSSVYLLPVNIFLIHLIFRSR